MYKARFDGKYAESEIEFDYSDSMFREESFCRYSQELAELSIAEMIIYKYGSLTDFMRATGFGGLYEYTHEENDVHKSRFIIMRKELPFANVINVAVHGTEGGEWYSNFDINKNAQSPTEEVHYGFKSAALCAYDALERYVGQFPERKNIYWITGHSRGAAAANILADMLEADGRASAAYTFAAPNVTRRPNRERNIYNIISGGDFVTVMPLKGGGWNYGRNGISIRADRVNNAEFEKYAHKRFNGIDGKIIDGLENKLRALCGSVEEYYSKRNGRLTAYEYFHDGLGGLLTGKSAAVLKMFSDPSYGEITRFFLEYGSGMFLKYYKTENGYSVEGFSAEKSFFKNADAVNDEHCLEAYLIRTKSLR